MAYVTVIGPNPDQVEYRLGGGHGCAEGTGDRQFSYRADARERPLRWIGRGLPAVGITPGSELTEAQFDMARDLMAGRDPRTGEVLVEPKRAVPEDAKVAVAPLVRMVEGVAAEANVSVAEVLGGRAKLVTEFERAQRAVDRRGEAARLRADEAGKLADAAGLDVEQVWGQDTYRHAAENLWETRTVNDQHGGARADGGGGAVREERVPRRVRVGNAGYDITLTLPKSLSMLLAFAPADTAAELERLYTEATNSAVAWMEDNTAYGMRGKHGGGRTADVVEGAGFLGWAMVHRAARPVDGAEVGDPHWHVHVTVANMTQADDGSWSTIAAGGRDLMRHAAALDHIVKARVRAALHDRYGIVFDRNPRTGAWEVTGIPDETLVQFSKRHTAIETMLREMGYDTATASRTLNRRAQEQTRGAKSEAVAAADATLQEIWQGEELAAGRDPVEHMRRVFGGGTDPHADPGDPTPPPGPGGPPPGGPSPGAPTPTPSAPTVPGQRGSAAAGTAAAAQPVAPSPTPSVAEIAAQLCHPETGLTAHTRRFTRADALARVADALPLGAATAAEVEALTDRVLADPVFIALPARGGFGAGPTPSGAHRADGADEAGGAGEPMVVGPNGRANRLESAHMRNAATWTTDDVVAVEKTILRAARASTPDQSPVRVRDREWITQVLDETQQNRPPLADEQLSALLRLVTEGRPIDTVTGVPGSGKTTLMRAVRTVMERAGYVVHGAATAAVAAQNLEVESGIESRTVAALVHALGRGEEPLRGVDMYVVDEANLTEDRDRARLYTHAARTGTRIVEIGDAKQLRGVGVGSLYRRVHEIVDGAELHHNRRQAEEDEREAIAAWRTGRYASALSIWSGKARLVPTETGQEAASAMLARWWDGRQGAPSPHAEMRGLVMLASTNEQVRRINDAAQAIRLAEHELGAGRSYRLHSGAQLRLHVGDHVLLRLNDRIGQFTDGATVLNGYRAVVTGIDQHGVATVEWEAPTADGSSGTGGTETKHATLRPDYIARGGVELGYAMTVHKSEGLTVGDQWEHATSGERVGATVLFNAAGADNPAAHVATSRHRGAVFVFAGRDELETQEDTYTRGVPRTYGELVERVTAKLVQRAQDTETHADDRPVVADLGLPEFASEDGEGRLQAAIRRTEREAEQTTRREQHEQWRRQKQQRAERRETREHQRRERAAADEAKRATAAELLREVWRHEPGLVEQIIVAGAFTAVARNLHDATEAGLDPRDLLADVPLNTVASPRVRDAAAFTASAINVAAQRAAAGHPTVGERDAARRDRQDAEQQARDQLADLLRDAWSQRPQLAEAVIDSPAFGAFVRAVEHAEHAGLDVDDLLAAVPVDQVDRDHVRDKGAYATYALRQVAARQERELTAARERGEDRAARAAQADATAAMLRTVWAAHPAAAEAVIGGPAYDVLADQISDAQDRGYDVETVLRGLDIVALTAPHVPSPSGSAAFALGRALAALPEPEPGEPVELSADTLAAARRFATSRGGTSTPTGGTAAAAERDPALDRAAAVNAAAATWFAQQLDAHPAALAYLDDRLPNLDQARRRYTIGYAPAAAPRALADHLRQAGYTEDDLAAAGLVRRNRHGIPVDRFRDRVLIGIHDEHGRTVGFIGRPPREPRENEPKYLNTPATALFDKSSVVFGLHESRQALADGATPVLVEGPLDVLALATADGATDLAPVASSGTAVTAAHLAAIARTAASDVLVIGLDGDQAGQHAAARTAALALDTVTGPRVLTLPDGHDPASWVAAHPHDPIAIYRDPTHQQAAAQFVAAHAIDSYFAPHPAAHRNEVEGQLEATRAALYAIRHVDHTTAATTALWIAQHTGVDPLTVAELLATARADLPTPEAPDTPEPGQIGEPVAEPTESAAPADLAPTEATPELAQAVPTVELSPELDPAAVAAPELFEPELGEPDISEPELAELELGAGAGAELASSVPHWTDRPHGRSTDHGLTQALADQTRTLAQAQATREQAEQFAEQRASEVAQRQGPQARAVDDDLTQARDQAAAVLDAQHLETQWRTHTNQAAAAAAERARLDQELADLGRLAGRRRAELLAQTSALRDTEDQAQRRAGALAEQAAALRHQRGIDPALHQQILDRARAAEHDHPHARQLAEQRDHDTAAAAQRRAERAAETEQQHRARLAELHTEHQTRAQLTIPARQLEDRERATGAERAPTGPGLQAQVPEVEAEHEVPDPERVTPEAGDPER